MCVDRDSRGHRVSTCAACVRRIKRDSMRRRRAAERAARGEMPRGPQLALFLRGVRGRSYDLTPHSEIAAKLGLSVGYVKATERAALRKIAAAMARLREERPERAWVPMPARAAEVEAA